jgi:hypothetical protein
MTNPVETGPGRHHMRDLNERGIAMITTLLMLMLMSALLVGFTAVIMSDQRYRFIDHDRGQAYYGASGGVEKLTSDLGNLFFSQLAPTSAQVTALTASGNLPVIPGITYSAAVAPSALPASFLAPYYCGPASLPTALSSKTVGTNGYTITFCTDATGNPVASFKAPVVVGPYAGLIALQTPYQLDVSARTSTGGEVHLIRSMDAVAIPVFQFGTFSDVDLAFFAGANFNFGGRAHTNGSLFLAEGTGATLTLNGKVTAVGEVIRQQLQNGVSIDTAPAHAGTVNVATSTSATRPLDRTEGSLVGGMGPPLSAQNEPTWHTISLSTYNGFIRNGRTGVTKLNLPLLTVGGTNPDLIRRPCQTAAATLFTAAAVPPYPLPCPATAENVLNPVLFNERLFTKASLRILLSDTATDITNLPTVTATLPVDLGSAAAADWRTTPPAAINGLAYGAPGVTAAYPPIARSLGQVAATTTTANTAAGDTFIPVNSVPAIFRKPKITAKSGATVRGGASFACTGTWTETQITGCTIPAGGSLSSGDTLYVSNPDGTVTVGAGNMPGNSLGIAAYPNPTVTLNGNVAAGANKTLNLTGVQTTWVFAANTFWINDVAGGGTGNSTLVTCTGTNAANTQFQGCTGVPGTTSAATITTSYLTPQNTGTIGGFLKIEKQDTAGVWTDVTMEILNYGIGGPNLAGFACTDPTPNAIVRLQRLRDNGGPGTCPNAGTTNSYDYWPNVLFDTREGLLRDTDPGNTSVALGGVMYYVALDVANLTRWFTATAPLNTPGGANAQINNTGYTVYFSDRRNNNNAASLETAEYGFEDFVNPLSATGAPNGTLDVGEDLNVNGVLDTYGKTPGYNGTYNSVPPGSSTPLLVGALPTTTITGGQAQVNRAILFRRALKLINGNNISDLGGAGLGIAGLTVVSENPVYVQGDWNSNDAGVSDFNGTHAATSIIADALTLLSNSWNDTLYSFGFPYQMAGNRSRNTQTWYRVAIIGGKGLAFPQPAGTATDFGTDGGAHNFLRFLEDGDQPVNYQGATATFFYSRQAVGTYKCCNTVYGAPTRNYAFDADFLNPALLPPNTPVFRDINAVGFSQELRPGR